MAKSKNEVYDDSHWSKSCRKNTEDLNTKISKLNEALSDSETNLCHYKLGLSQVKARLVKFKTQEIKFCEKIKGLEFDVKNKNIKIENLMNEVDQIKKEKEGLDSKLTGFESAPKDLDTLLESQRSDKNKEGLGYSVVPPSCSTECVEVKTNKVKAARKPAIKYAEITPTVNRTNMNVAQLKRTSFAKTAHSYVRRPFHQRSAVRTQSQVPRVSTVTKRFPAVDSKFSTAKSTFSTNLGNKGKAVKASACWIWRPKQNTTEKCPNCNSVSVIFKKFQYIDTQGRLKSSNNNLIIQGSRSNSKGTTYRAAGFRMRALLLSTSRRTDIPKADMQPRKRACLTTPAPGFKVRESSAAGATRQSGPALEFDRRQYRFDQTGYGITDTWNEIVDTLMEIVLTTLEGVNHRVTELDTTVRPDHHHTSMLLDSESMYAREAWVGSDYRSAAIKAYVRTLEVQIATLIAQISSLILM
uniref:Uncharacterized protein n=1 Tax=Tanacetum cinerariifolium TaxID=118510 RepID=A0A6L2L3D0_TANCI|nr:hypothetical protein [Tanacetum cinerariifolium]